MHVFGPEAPDRPQPRLDRDRGGGFTVSVGRLRVSAGQAADAPAHAFQFSLLSHNTILGAAGSALLNAELALHHGWLTLLPD
jgi:aspartate-semialdehyde dehydrogenase